MRNSDLRSIRTVSRGIEQTFVRWAEAGHRLVTMSNRFSVVIVWVVIAQQQPVNVDWSRQRAMAAASVRGSFFHDGAWSRQLS